MDKIATRAKIELSLMTTPPTLLRQFQSKNHKNVCFDTILIRDMRSLKTLYSYTF